MLARLRATADPVKRAQMDALCGAMCDEFDREIKSQLRPAQARRLTEISMQHAGDRALLTPEAALALNLDPERQEEIKEILSELDARERELETALRKEDVREFAKFPAQVWDKFKVTEPFLDRHERHRKALETIRNQAHRQVRRLLTDRQRKKFNAMLGEPFDPETHRTAADGPQKPR
jgi:molecular chaperone GrpE (heat shock protein)